MSLERQPGMSTKEKAPAPQTAQKPSVSPSSPEQEIFSSLKELRRDVSTALVGTHNRSQLLLGLLDRAQAVEQQVRVVFEARKHEEEKKALPLLRINKKQIQAEIDGKILRFRKNNTSAFGLLVFLAENPSRDIKAAEIKGKVFPKKGPEEVSNQMEHLRKIVGDDKNERQIIVHAGIGNISLYRFNARVEFTNGDIRFSESPKAEKRKRKPYLGRAGIDAAYAAFVLNDARDGLKHLSAEDIFEAVYSDTSKRYRGRRADLKYRCCKRMLPLILDKIRQVWSSDPDSLNPKLGKFMRWLKSQPEYANAQIDDLARLAKREITFAEFLEKSGYSKPAEISLPVAPVAPVSDGKVPHQMVEGNGHPVNNGGTVDREKVHSPEEMILTDPELFALFLCLNKERIGGIFMISGGMTSMPSDLISDLSERANKVLTEVYSKTRVNGLPAKLPVVDQNLLDELRSKMQMFAENPDVFIGAQSSDATKEMFGCLKEIQLLRLPGFVSALIPQELTSLGLPRNQR